MELYSPALARGNIFNLYTASDHTIGLFKIKRSAYRIIVSRVGYDKTARSSAHIALIYAHFKIRYSDRIFILNRNSGNNRRMVLVICRG